MIKRLLQQVKGTRKLLAASIATGTAGGLLLIGQAVYIASIVDGAFLGGRNLAALWTELLVLLGIIAARSALHGAGEYMSTQMAQRIKSDLRRRLVRKLAELGPQYAKGERSGELLGTLYEGIEQLESYLAKYVPQMALSAFIPAAVFVVVAGYDWISAGVFAVTLPLLVLLMILIGKAAKDKTDRQFRLLGRLGGHFHEVLRGLPTLKMFNRSRAQIGIIARISEEYRRSTMGTLRLAFLSALVMELFAALSTAIVAVFLGLRLIKGEIGFEAAFLVLLLAPDFYTPIRTLGAQFHAGMNGVTAAERIFGILQTQPAGWTENENGLRLPTKREGYRITFDNVSVRYPGADRAALSGLSLTIEPGERVAVIGPTGAGKSTLLDLLQGFVKPTEGRIYIDGVELSQISIAWWREQLSVLEQRVHLFHGTVADNVRLGRPEATDAELIAACQAAQAHDFIQSLPCGYNAKLGEAVKLSGGQAQRVAMARALLRDCPVLLLDEPTNGLDLASEAIVAAALEPLLQSRTSITVSHRLDTVRSADRVVVIAEGKLVEHGAPGKLLAAGGLYARMLQAAHRDLPLVDGGLKKESLLPEAAFEASLGSSVAHSLAADPDTTAAGGDAAEGEASNDNPAGAGWRTFVRLLQFVRPYKWRALLGILLGIFTVAMNIGLMGTSGYLIAKAALRPETVLLLYVPIVGVRFFGITRGVSRYVERLVSHDVTFRIVKSVRVWLYERLEPRGVRLFESRRSGDVLGTVISDAEQLQNLYLRVIAPPLVALFTLLLGFAFLAHAQLGLGLLLAGMMLLTGFVVPWLSHRLGQASGKAIVRSRSDMYAETSDLIAGLPVLAVYGQLGRKEALMADAQGRLDAYQQTQNRIAACTAGVMAGMSQLTMWLVLAMAIAYAAAGSIDGVLIPALVLVALASFEPVLPLPLSFQQLGQTLYAGSRLFRLADEDADAAPAPQAGQKPHVRQVSEVPAPEAPPVTQASEVLQAPAPQAPDRRTTASPAPWQLKVSGLSFRYRPKGSCVLRDLSLTLEQGKRVAVVGESGAGKSTLLQALLRLRPYEAGSVSINGADLHTLDEEAVREQFAVVSQRVQLFNATVADNLRLGRSDATMEELREACRIARIEDTIMQLPDGYHTIIGEWGAKLSGGECQRLALARALVRQAPAILFDEPSTGLDPLTEQAFNVHLEPLLADKAVLWITHKLSGLEKMDEIILLHNGIVHERGTHDELMSLGKMYRKLWDYQQSDSRQFDEKQVSFRIA
ncbi:thiol reductant ABC exporter subunit CydD [Paenibacillus thalictri]|uniref:Thiol reductant ABC exporter subunit CydD n=1 Tax=Paenibacillus thalictri TaxID=2527873 RepID=A0A4Q9DMT5_9BACL|nr:thiol reductant ABC exporter subunit CydD [Paenibacillus thalictri]TBL76094.1 thiol reductant ABC exporter subunit CydD [Paenibacillus thalictri]